MTKIVDVESTQSEVIKINEMISLTSIANKNQGFEMLRQYSADLKNHLNTLAVDSIIEELSEDNLQELKSIGTSIRKEITTIEDRRKAVEKLYNADLAKFKKDYKEYAYTPLDKTVKKIKTAVDNFEDTLRERKSKRFMALFESNKNKMELDFLEYEDVGLNVQLSTSENELEKQLKDFFEKVNNDLKIINLGEHKERTLAEYHKTKDLSTAIINVKESVESEKRIAERIEARKLAEMEYEEQAKKRIEAQKEASHETKEQIATTNTPEEVYVEPEALKLIKARIIVTGTRQQLKTLQEFMRNEGIKYE